MLDWISGHQRSDMVTEKSNEGRYVLRLYITGSTPRSKKAIVNLKRICNEELGGKYDLEIIDIYQQPALAEGEQIIAAPTLIKRLPEPMRKLVGDLSDTERVLMGLDIKKGRKEGSHEQDE